MAFKLLDKVVIKDTSIEAEKYNNKIGTIVSIRHVPGERVSDGVPFIIYYVKWDDGEIQMHLPDYLLYYTRLHSLLK